MFAKNSDRPPGEPQRVEWCPTRREATTATTYLTIDGAAAETVGFVGSRPTWMWGVEHGVNEAGVAIGNETIFTTLDPRAFPDALVGMDLVRLGLERATTASQAVEVMTGLLERYGQGGSGHEGGHHPYWSSFLVADPGSGWVVETSGTTWEAEAVEATRAISNRCTIPSFDAHHGRSQDAAPLVDPRWEASKSVLAAGPLAVTSAKDHLRSHAGGGDGWTVCMHVDGLEATTAAMVAELPGPGPARRPLARFSLGWPCRSIFVPVLVGHPLGDVPAWERFADLPAERPAALDDLERDLEAGATEAAAADDPTWNATAWDRVRSALQ